MTLRKEIAKARRKFYAEADSSQMGEEIELIIDRIDEIADELETQSVAINILDMDADGDDHA